MEGRRPGAVRILLICGFVLAAAGVLFSAADAETAAKVMLLGVLLVALGVTVHLIKRGRVGDIAG